MSAHPVYGPNPFKLGIFSANADGGLTLTTVPERWQARWSDIAKLCRMADEAGIEFFLPIARWKGFGGATNSREHSFETFTFAAALAAITSRIGIFSSIHVPMIHPVYAAKALATVDHVSNGRAGLNIVAGWNPDEFAMFGIHAEAERYAQALEWYEVISRIYAEDAPFDFTGKYYQLKNVSGKPLPVQQPRPVTFNAAFGEMKAPHTTATSSGAATPSTQLISNPHQATAPSAASSSRKRTVRRRAAMVIS